MCRYWKTPSILYGYSAFGSVNGKEYRISVLIKRGKGRKDRCTLLSEKAVRLFAEYCKTSDIQNWLFPGQPVTSPLSIRSAQKYSKKPPFKRISTLTPIYVYYTNLTSYNIHFPGVITNFAFYTLGVVYMKFVYM